MSRLTNYIRNVALVTDDEINAIFGGMPPPSPQGTISLRAAVANQYGKGYKKWLGRGMCAFLSFGCRMAKLVAHRRWEPCNHCGEVLQGALNQGQEL